MAVGASMGPSLFFSCIYGELDPLRFVQKVNEGRRRQIPPANCHAEPPAQMPGQMLIQLRRRYPIGVGTTAIDDPLDERVYRGPRPWEARDRVWG
jgi:hypothetical protein